MKMEIERRFLVADTSILNGLTGLPITQGYLPKSSGELSSRVRIAGEHAWLTMKTPRTSFGREEYEFPIPLDDARLLIDRHCGGRTLSKLRFVLPCEDVVFEIDVFSGALRGLVIAEVELQSADQVIPMPHWLGREITREKRFGNAALAKHGNPRQQPAQTPPTTFRPVRPQPAKARSLLPSLRSLLPGLL